MSIDSHITDTLISTIWESAHRYNSWHFQKIFLVCNANNYVNTADSSSLHLIISYIYISKVTFEERF